jgi:hypothetical protein
MRMSIGIGFERVSQLAQYYFAYGSNMNIDRVRKREMVFDHHFGGALHDYELVFNKRSVKYPGAASANVSPRSGAVTEGVLYRLTEPDQIERMDPFEGYPVRYDRLVLPVRQRQETFHAWVYVANTDYIVEGLKPARWYLEHLLAGEEFLSAEYMEKLRIVDCLLNSEHEP